MSNYQQEFREPERPADFERQREAATDRLTAAYAADRLTVEEYERRVAAVQAARAPADLDALLSDLPAQAASPAPAAGTGRAPVALHGPEATVACVMGDRQMAGNWLTSDRVSTFTVMGSTKLDLRDTDLPVGPIKINVFTLMGETVVIVPRWLPVRLRAMPFMAEAKAGRDVSQDVRNVETWVEIDGFVCMGSLVVKAKD